MQGNRKNFYLQTSMFTDLGKYKEEAIELFQNKCKKSLKKLCLYLMNATIHHVVVEWATQGKDVHEYGDFSYIDYGTLMNEDDIFLTASSMFAEILRRDKKGFYIGRPVKTRINVSCRYVSVLVSSILKANGISCRSRAGWARYLERGKILDHWVNEYYDEELKKWIRFDLDDLYDDDWLKDDFYKENRICEEYLNFGDGLFYTAAEMWQLYRKDPKIIEGLKYGTTETKPKEILNYLFLDFWAVNNLEYNYKFKPLRFYKNIDELSADELRQVDGLAELMLDVDKNYKELEKLFNTPSFRMVLSPLVDEANYSALIKSKNY